MTYMKELNDIMDKKLNDKRNKVSVFCNDRIEKRTSEYLNNVIQPSDMTKQYIEAGDILKAGVKAILNRAQVRDVNNERSMRKTVNAFNAMYNTELTEVQGWQFMVLLKMCRASQGNFRMDDYEDQASYSALAGEAAQE